MEGLSSASNLRKIAFYFFVIGVFALFIYFTLQKGTSLEFGRPIVTSYGERDFWDYFEGLQHPLAILLGQIVVIILVARTFGVLAQKIGQPAVVGEVIAGIMLGPSLLGFLLPEISATLFPPQSLGNLQLLSQVGLILFMFVIGMELDLRALRSKAHDAVVISHASIIVPFALGVCFAFFTYRTLAPASIGFTSFALFMGIAMSITAFPVLARIVQERGIQKTRLGTIAITCAAADDITAWCALAAVIAIAKAGSLGSALLVMLSAVAYVALMLKIVKPFLKRVADLHSSRESLTQTIVAIFFLTLIISSYVTEVIGIHALFGAFMTGAIIPENIKFRNIFIEKVEDVSVILLLPLFFVFTGLRTQIGLLDDPSLWATTAIVIAVAVTGKFLGSALAAKFVGQSWKDSLSIGALMNTRGLVELVVLNIGYDLGVLTPEVFAMLVIMALVTTMMTGPALDLINRAFRDTPDRVSARTVEALRYKVLISFANPETGRSLFRFAHNFTRNHSENSELIAMHLSPVTDLSSVNVDEYEQESFSPLLEESRLLGRKVATLFKTTADVESDIAEIANKGDYDLLLIGVGKSIYQGTLLGKVLGFTTRIFHPNKILSKFSATESWHGESALDSRTSSIVSKTNVPIGVFIGNNFTEAVSIIMPVGRHNDSFLLDYAQRFIANNKSQVTILELSQQLKSNHPFRERIRQIEQMVPNHISISSDRELNSGSFKSHDLMVISLQTWTDLVRAGNRSLAESRATLIVRN
jgi:Kef-type K+ transport system membrane component KefB